MAPESWAEKYLSSDHHTDRKVRSTNEYVLPVRTGHARKTSQPTVSYVSSAVVPDDVRVIIDNDVEEDQPTFKRYIRRPVVAQSKLQINLSRPPLVPSYGRSPLHNYTSSSVPSYGMSSLQNYTSSSVPYQPASAMPSDYHSSTYRPPLPTSSLSHLRSQRRCSITDHSLLNGVSSETRSFTHDYRKPLYSTQTEMNSHMHPDAVAFHRRHSVSQIPNYAWRPSDNQTSAPVVIKSVKSYARRPSVTEERLTSRRPSVTIISAPSPYSTSMSNPSSTSFRNPSSRGPSVERYTSYSRRPSITGTDVTTTTVRSRQSSPFVRRGSRAGSHFESFQPVFSRQSSVSRFSSSRGPSMNRM